MAEIGCIRRIETGCEGQPVLYQWVGDHAPEVTRAVSVERWPGLAESYSLYGGCDDESPDTYDTLEEALHELWRDGPHDLCWECSDVGCPACAEASRG